MLKSYSTTKELQQWTIDEWTQWTTRDHKKKTKRDEKKAARDRERTQWQPLTMVLKDYFGKRI
jgi:hypothetical protein